MTRNRTIQLIAMCGLAICVGTAGLLMKPINKERLSLQLDVGQTTSDTAVPPHIILQTAALGSFRGLLVDYLWYRVNQLKEQGKYYEINALSQYITTLQPRFPQVWAFHAWNMAYNISVTTSTPQERWSWVNNGIKLLRDQGIPLNPRSVRLYRELSWIFFHKIGQMTDDMHWYYKAELAKEWQEVLGAPNPDATTTQIIERFRRVADAYDTIEEVRASDPVTSELVDKLLAAGIEPDEQLLRQVNSLIMVGFSMDAQILGLNMENIPDALGIRPALMALLRDPKYGGQPFQTLMSYLAKRTIIDHYHMDPQRMLSLMEEFGPLDWRHPSAHGEYWSTIGVEMFNEVRNPTDSDLLNTYRQKLHSFQDLTRYGRINYDAVTNSIDMLPDPRFIPAYDKAYDIAIDMAKRTEQWKVETAYGNGHENFLLMAMSYMYLYGDMKDAETYYLRAKELYGETETNLHKKRYDKTVEELVMEQFQLNQDMIDISRQFIDAMVATGIREGLANNDGRIFDRYLRLAKAGYDSYMSKKADMLTPLAQQDRLSMPSFPVVVMQSYVGFMRSGSIDLMAKARIWANTPPSLQIRVYDELIPVLAPQATKAGLSGDIVFPKPEGYEPPGLQVPTLPGQTTPGTTPDGPKVERK